MSVLIVVNVTFDSLSRIRISFKEVKRIPLLFDHIEEILEMLLYSHPLIKFLTLWKTISSNTLPSARLSCLENVAENPTTGT